jgi:hypothetical protein
MIEDLIWSNGGAFTRISRTRGKILTKKGDNIRFYTFDHKNTDGLSADIAVSDPDMVSDDEYFALQQIVCRSAKYGEIWTFGQFEGFIQSLRLGSYD